MLVRSSTKARTPAHLTRTALAPARTHITSPPRPLGTSPLARQHSPRLPFLPSQQARTFALSHRRTQPFAMAAADPSNSPQPPVRPPSWSSFTPELVTSSVDKVLDESTAFLDKLVAIPPAERTFESVVRPLALQSAEADRKVEPALFLQYVHADQAMRDASVEADKKVNDWSLDALTRRDVFEALLDADKHTRDNAVQLDDEEKRLLERLVLERKRNGLGLDDDKRTKFLELKKRLTSLEIEFQKNCNEEKGFMLFTKEVRRSIPLDAALEGLRLRARRERSGRSGSDADSTSSSRAGARRSARGSARGLRDGRGGRRQEVQGALVPDSLVLSGLQRLTLGPTLPLPPSRYRSRTRRPTSSRSSSRRTSRRRASAPT